VTRSSTCPYFIVSVCYNLCRLDHREAVNLRLPTTAKHSKPLNKKGKFPSVRIATCIEQNIKQEFSEFLNITYITRACVFFQLRCGDCEYAVSINILILSRTKVVCFRPSHTPPLKSFQAIR